MGTKVSAKIDVIDRNSDWFVVGETDAEQRKGFHQFAREELKKARDQNKAALGYAPDYDLRVDGHNAPIEKAALKSLIEVEFELSTAMYQWIADMLILNSPVGKSDDPRPGHPELYARSHLFFVDGNQMDPYGPLPPHEEAVFVNIQPYARKIERGNFSMQAPDGVYEVVAVMARQKYSNIGSIRFGYRTPYNFGAIHEWANTTTMQSPHRRGEKRDEWLRRQPAVVIRP